MCWSLYEIEPAKKFSMWTTTGLGGYSNYLKSTHDVRTFECGQIDMGKSRDEIEREISDAVDKPAKTPGLDKAYLRRRLELY